MHQITMTIFTITAMHRLLALPVLLAVLSQSAAGAITYTNNKDLWRRRRVRRGASATDELRAKARPGSSIRRGGCRGARQPPCARASRKRRRARHYARAHRQGRGLLRACVRVPVRC
ncbi:MAG: hypothetical protein KF817_16180, partial [Phycisphaeraceae bacterium]|nr:hypothetical protein [Phycisphaeraceae bacterium]